MLTAQETLLGRGARAESSRVREPRRTARPPGLQSRVLWGGISFWAVSGRAREPRRTAPPPGLQSRVLWGGISFWVVSGQSF